MRMAANEVTLQCVVGDIGDQPDVEVIVNSANPDLQPRGSKDPVHIVAGPELAEACIPLAPLAPGYAVMTPAFGLPNDFVIHSVGPVYGQDEPSAEILARCYAETLQLAETVGITSIAFPPISIGASGYPLESAAEVACSTTVRLAPDLRQVRLVRFVVPDQATYSHRALDSSVVMGPGSARPFGRLAGTTVN